MILVSCRLVPNEMQPVSPRRRATSEGFFASKLPPDCCIFLQYASTSAVLQLRGLRQYELRARRGDQSGREPLSNRIRRLHEVPGNGLATGARASAAGARFQTRVEIMIVSLTQRTLKTSIACAVVTCVASLPSIASAHDLGGVEAQGRYDVVHPIEDALPRSQLTPGAVDPRVTQANTRSTICVRGYTKQIRPLAKYTSDLKRKQIARYGYEDRRLRDYEEDHLISLELGGSPTSPKNLWPEPRHVVGGWGADAKDQLENELHRRVCRGELPLAEAQHSIATDWVATYKKYVGEAVVKR